MLFSLRYRVRQVGINWLDAAVALPMFGYGRTLAPRINPSVSTIDMRPHFLINKNNAKLISLKCGGL